MPSLAVWPFQMNIWQPSQRKPFLRVPSQHLPTPPLRRLLWRLPRRGQPLLWDLQRSPILLRPQTWSQPEGNLHQIDSLGRGKCHILPGQSLPPCRSPQSPKVPNRDLVAKVLGKGWLNVEGQRNRFKTQGQPTSSTGMLETLWQVTPPPGFRGVMTCLQRDLLPVDTHEAPPDPLQLVVVVEPTVVTMSASCIMKDEATGMTYMDPVTTSVGQVALSSPSQGTPATGPIIEDTTNLSRRTSPWLPLGRRIEMPLGRNHNLYLIIMF